MKIGQFLSLVQGREELTDAIHITSGLWLIKYFCHRAVNGVLIKCCCQSLCCLRSGCLKCLLQEYVCCRHLCICVHLLSQPQVGQISSKKSVVRLHCSEYPAYVVLWLLLLWSLLWYSDQPRIHQRRSLMIIKTGSC